MQYLKKIGTKIFLSISIVMSLNIIAAEKGCVVGYIPFWQNPAVIDSIDFTQMTHLCYAFLTPHSDATMYTDLNRSLLEKMIEKARPEGLKIMIAIGGGAGELFDPDTALTKLLDDTTSTLKFVSYVMDIVREYDLDGVSNDWEPFENPDSKADKYEFLMETFSDSLKPLNKILSSDVIAGAWATGYMSERSIELSDYLNVMAYVFNSNAINEIDGFMQYWLNVKKAPKEKLNIAIGFFGTVAYQWSYSLTYPEIVAADSMAFTKDSATINEKLYWYNGPNMCKKIVDLAWQKYNGVAIWHLGLDNYSGKSLLNVISARMDDNKNGNVANITDNQVKLKLSANIFTFNNKKLQIINDLNSICIYDLRGRLVYSISDVKKGMNINLRNALGVGQFIVTGIRGNEFDLVKVNFY